MVTVEVSTKLTVEDLIAAAEQLPSDALDEFVNRLHSMQARRSIFVEPGRNIGIDSVVGIATEQELLQTIEAQSLGETERERLLALREKNVDGTLTAEEHVELLDYVRRTEQQDVVRLESLIKLAQMRGVTLQAVMRQLGIEPRFV